MRLFGIEKAVRALRVARPPLRAGNAFLDSRKPNIVVSDGEADGEEIFALGKLPAQEDTILSENFGMLCQGEWQNRQLVLNSDFAMISLVGSEDILDKVPLVPTVSIHGFNPPGSDTVRICSMKSKSWHTLMLKPILNSLPIRNGRHSTSIPSPPDTTAAGRTVSVLTRQQVPRPRSSAATIGLRNSNWRPSLQISGLHAKL
jgi:hypothetical protein